MMAKTAKTKSEKMQDFVRFYKEKHGVISADMHDVAAEAEKMGWKMPKPKSPLDLLAAQFSDSQREEIRHDEKTGLPYRANLAVSTWQGQTQQVLWTDIDVAPRAVAHKALSQYRDQMVGEAVQLTTTAQHWNRINPSEEPITPELDFGPDVDWELSAREMERKKAA
jgi:hypothetical protein